jgi:hypothetical protein
MLKLQKMIWFVSLAVWSLSLLPVVYVLSKPKTISSEQWEKRWQEEDEPTYYFDPKTKTVKRRA